MLSEERLLTISRDVALWFELGGIVVIICGTLYAFGRLGLAMARLEHLIPGSTDRTPIAGFRKALGRSILTGLELLVAADIIQSVAVQPTVESVLVLGAIVLIRTFLSFSLEVEINGRWPWQQRKTRRDDG